MVKRFIGAQYPLVKGPRGIMAPLTEVDQIKADLLQLLLTNPGERCLIGSTLIPLANGEVVPIEQLVSREYFWVYSYNSETDSIVGGRATAHKTGNDVEFVEVLLDNEKTVFCTEDHLWLMRDGTYKKAKDLKENDSLMPLYKNTNTSGYERIYQPYLRDYRETHLNFVIGKREEGIREVVHHVDLNKKNNSPDNLQWMTRKGHKDLHKEISNAFLIKFKEDPEFKEKWLNKQKIGLKKYYENNPGHRKGVKLTEETKSKLSKNKIGFYQTEKGIETKKTLSEKAKKQFAEKGFPSLGYKHTEESKQKMRKPRPSISGDLNPSKRPEVIEKIKKTWAKKILNHKVTSVAKSKIRADCYDLHVEKYHNFALDVGVFVHNCMLPLFGVPLKKLMFEPNDTTLEMQARVMISNAIATWEPRIEVENIIVTSSIDSADLHPQDFGNERDAILNIKIRFYDPQEINEIQELSLMVPIAG